MNVQRYLLASIAASVWLLLYGFVVNAMLLDDFWSSQGLVMGYIFIRGHEGRGIGEGFRFGVLMALFLASIYLLFYAIQQWSLTSLVASILADGLGVVGAGVVLALLYKPAAA